ncbi:hypothetical protein DL96DRAFT_1070049 [Flagelloscypha sp. PMI_526]|nr:hypothetical protein DL96DRAFT_1070049 [Flagelloscypha sp. PMI_526]
MARESTTAGNSRRPGPLRRSASIASLPTPPRTTHKRKRALRALDSDEDNDSESTRDQSESESEEVVKRRKLAVADKNDDQDAFWLGDEDEDATVLLNNFRKRSASHLASPPPSFRGKPVTGQQSPPTLASPPSTPPRKVNPSAGPIRDSPNNPFLSPLASDEEIGDNSSLVSAASVDTWIESPTITMVYRGTKRVFNNPHYDPETGRAKPPNPNSLLPLEHPDYEADFRVKPCALFPKRKKGSATSSQVRVAPVASTSSKPSLLTGPRVSHLDLDPFGAPPATQTVAPLFEEDVMDRYFSRIASNTPF